MNVISSIRKPKFRSLVIIEPFVLTDFKCLPEFVCSVSVLAGAQSCKDTFFQSLPLNLSLCPLLIKMKSA